LFWKHILWPLDNKYKLIENVYGKWAYLTQQYIPQKFLGGICPCKDCGMETIHGEYPYLVLDSVWAEAHKNETTMWKDAGFLCIGCLESRIGRRLKQLDFRHYSDLLVNKRVSPRLLSRLEDN
jgi:hypothetical protein